MAPHPGNDMAEAVAPPNRKRTSYSIYCWLISSLILIIFGPLIVAWPGSRAQRRGIARIAARLLFRLAGMPLRIEHLDRLPPGKHLLIVNHTSFLDGLILSAVLPASPGYAFVARQQFRRQVLLWPLLHAVGTVILHKHASHDAQSNVDLLAAVLLRGENLVIFPEGGIERTAGLRPFHTGAFVVAARCGVPVVLAGIKGARQALPLRTWQPCRTPITISIGAVVAPESIGENTLENIAQTARETIAQLAGEPVRPASEREP